MDGLHEPTSIAPNVLSTPDSSVEIERDPLTGDVLAVHGDIESLLGVSAADLTEPGALLELVHQSDRDRMAPAVSDTDTLTYRVKNNTGRHVWISEKLRDASTANPGAVVSELRNVDAKITAVRLAEALDRFTDAVVIFELAETPGTLTVVACNDAGAELVAPAGEQVTVGQIPELAGEDGDFVDLLSGVITDQEPFAFIVSGGENVAASTLTAECLDAHTGLVLLRQYTSPITESAFDGVVEATDPEPTAVDESDRSAVSFFTDLQREATTGGEPLELMMSHLGLSSISEWELSLEAGTATLTSAAPETDLPDTLDLSGAAIHRLEHMSGTASRPDPAVVAVQRRLDAPDGIAVARLASTDETEPTKIVVAIRTAAWSDIDLDQFEFATTLLTHQATETQSLEDDETGAARAGEVAQATEEAANAQATAAELAELLDRERFIGSVTRTLLAATTETLSSQVMQLTNILRDRFDVEHVELWQFDERDDATHCADRWSELTIESPSWIHVSPQQSDESCGAVRFVSSTSTWTTDELLALDAVGELVWSVCERVEAGRQFTSAFEHAPVAVVICTTDGTIAEWNDRYLDLVGYDANGHSGSLRGVSFARFATIDGRAQLAELTDAASNPDSTDEECTADVPFRRTDESVAWGRVHMAQAKSAASEDIFIAHIEDVSDTMMRQRALEYQVGHDDLTLLATRQRLTQALADTCANPDAVATLLLIDLDRFENIRDRYGRDQADQVLRVVADRLRTLVRPEDLVARTGPAEFAILLSGDESDASALATRLLSNIADPVLVRHTEILTTANIGIAAIAEADQTTTVLRKADNALDAAKGAGRLASATFDTALHEQLLRDERLEADLGDAIGSGAITMHYQPEVTLRTGELQGFEALARWDHPEFGMLESTEFVAHADRIGVIRDIDDLAVDTAATQMALWQRQFPDRVRNVRVNVSGTSIRSQSFIDRLKKVLTEHEITPSSFWIEVSEDELLGNGEPPLDQLAAIKDIGCKILIDDFGHGLSSFSMLRRMPVDALKIEPALIRSLGLDPDAGTIVSATIQLSRTLDLECVAEGIETHAQATELIELGCQWGHGHLFSPALPAAEFSTVITEGRVEAFDRHDG